jgi:Bacterial TniB protein
MLMLDEVHNMLAAPSQRQRELLNLLRHLGNELRIPVVCLGTREAYLAIRSDDQLENRFEPFLLPAWEDGPELGRLLASFEAVLPMREASGLGSPAMRTHVLRRAEGTVGEIAALLAADTALQSGQERIDAARPSMPRRISRPRCGDACSSANCDDAAGTGSLA